MPIIVHEYQMNYIADANATAAGFNESRENALIGQGEDGKLYMKVDGLWEELPYTDGVKNNMAEEGGFVTSERVYSCLSADGDMKPDVVSSWSDTITDKEKYNPYRGNTMNADGTLAVNDRLMVWSSDPQALEQKALATLNATAPDNTGRYGCESFGQEEARPTGSHSLYALDLNGDGKLEYPTVSAYLKTSTSEVKQGTRLQENADGEIDFDAPRIPDNDFVVMNGMMIYHPQEDAQALRNAEFWIEPLVTHQ